MKARRDRPPLTDREKRKRRWFLAGTGAALVLLAAAAGLVQATATHIAVLAAARFLLFFAAGGVEPVFLAKLAHLTKPERRGTIFGMNASLRNFGVLSATLLSGGVIFLVGTRGVFLIGALLCPLVFPLMFLLTRLERRRAPEPAPRQ